MNSWDETVELLHQLETMKSVPSNDFLLNLFKQIRKSKMSKSDIVIKYGPNLVKSVYDEREGILIKIFMIIELLVIRRLFTKQFRVYIYKCMYVCL